MPAEPGEQPQPRHRRQRRDQQFHAAEQAEGAHRPLRIEAGADDAGREHRRGGAGRALNEAERDQRVERADLAGRGRGAAISEQRQSEQSRLIEARAKLAEQEQAERGAGDEGGEDELGPGRRAAEGGGQARHGGQDQVGAGEAEHGAAQDEDEGGARPFFIVESLSRPRCMRARA